MCSQSHYNRAIERGLIVPMSAIETYVANGWSLADEPDCSGGRMQPPRGHCECVISSNRVSSHKMTGRSGHREPVENDLHNERNKTGERKLQAR
jgi:hypothetical protein